MYCVVLCLLAQNAEQQNIDYYCGFFEVVGYHILSRPTTSFLSPKQYCTVNVKVLNLLSTRFTSIIPSWPLIHRIHNKHRVLFSLHVNTFTHHLCALGTMFHSIYLSKIPYYLANLKVDLVCTHLNNLTLLVWCYTSKNWSVVVYSTTIYHFSVPIYVYIQSTYKCL